MIRKAKYENFKGLRSVEVAFDSRFTVLVGPNASGKTSVLQGIELVIELWDHGDIVPNIDQFAKAQEAMRTYFCYLSTTPRLDLGLETLRRRQIAKLQDHLFDPFQIAS